MIHLIHSGNRALYVRELDEMFRLRARFFKEVLGWSALTVTDGEEIDCYDDDQAMYLIAIEEDGGVSVSVRLRPTKDRSLLLDHFPHLVAENPPAIAKVGVWESCRYFASSRARGPQGARRREELRLAMVETAQRYGVDRIVAITDTVFLPSLIQASWTTRLLGLPARYDEGECVALEISCSAEAHLRMQERLGLSDAVVLDLDPDLWRDLPPRQIENILAAGLLNKPDARELLAITSQFSPWDKDVLTGVIKRLAGIADAQGPHAAVSAIRDIIGLLQSDQPRF